ncbi:MAG: hypothetical protein CMM01_22130 [Rhodopirellula sp.]|nr:hypothetical protein [Rhodopirellula sp.]OUX49514.1 MAG: hypothetical protein CBE43_09915 [Rhodopirellula sp. TMED283]
MGGVPVLLMLMLFGPLSAKPHLGVCISQIADHQNLSETCLSGLRSFDHGLQVREDLADQTFGNDADLEVWLVSDRTFVRKTTSSTKIKSRPLQADDSSPIAIPELRIDSSDCVLNAARNSRVIIMQKPDNSGVSGSGFSFPSIPPSLAEAGQSLAQNVDRAGRPIDPAASASGATNGTTLPSTTVANPSSFAIPPFTNSTGAAPAGAASANTLPAAIQAAPPVSLRDAGTRTTNWGQFPLPTTAPTATVSNPSAVGANTAPEANAVATGIPSAGTRTPGASPLLPTDTFGRTPRGLTAATTGRTTPPAYSTVQQSTTNPAKSGFMHVPTTDSIFSRNQTANTNAATSFTAGSTTSSPVREVNAANNLNSVRPTSSGQAVAGVPVGQPPIGRFGANPSASFSPTASVAYPAITSGAPVTNTGFPAARPDTRLSVAQVAAGAWSVDAFGQPVDRSGQRISSAPAINHGQRLNDQAQTTGTAGFGRPFANQTATHMTTVRPHAGGGHSMPQGSMTEQKEGASKFNHPTGNWKSNQADGASLASKTNSLPRIAETQVIETESVTTTTQPLFNGLLLISIVANVYLIFWLKNLRLQYHDMVAAKRMASSTNASSN